MNMIKLFGQPLRLNKKATGDFRVRCVRHLLVVEYWKPMSFLLLLLYLIFRIEQAMDVGANLFIGNLDPEVRVHEKPMNGTKLWFLFNAHARSTRNFCTILSQRSVLLLATLRSACATRKLAPARYPILFCAWQHEKHDFVEIHSFCYCFRPVRSSRSV